MEYPTMFKNAMIQKMTGPEPVSATQLSKEVDVPQATLSQWLRKAGICSPYAPVNADEYTKMTKINMPKPPNGWSPEEKLKVVIEAASLHDEQLGAFIRNKGLHSTHLDQWRSQMIDGLENRSELTITGLKKDAEKRIRLLEKELNRKDKALAETAALLVLKKKLQEIWGDEDCTTPGKTEK